MVLNESAGNKEISVEIADQALTFVNVWRKTLQVSRQHGWAMVCALLVPVGKMLLGLYGSMVLTLLFVQWNTQPERLGQVQDHAWIILLVSLGIALLGLAIFLNGCWQYMVYWVSLCRNAQQAFENQPMDIPGAHQEVNRFKKGVYARWLAVVFFLLPVLPWLPWCFFPFLALALHTEPALILLVALLVLSVSGLLGIAWLAAQIMLTYGIQALSLEPVSPSILPVMKRSVSLTLQRPWLTLGLQASLFLVTSYILPMPAVFLLRFSRLVQPLDDLNGWLCATVSGSWMDAMPQENEGEILHKVTQVLSTDGHINLLSLAQGVTDSMLGMTISLLLLPLGTIAFTWVYLHLRSVGTSQPLPYSSKPLD